MPCQAQQAISYTMPNIARPYHYHAMPTRPYHIPCFTSPGHYDILCHAQKTIPCQCDIPCDAHKAISVTMPCPPDHIIYHDMPDRPYHISCYACQAIPYTCHLAKPHHIQSHTLPGNTIYHAMPAKQYHIYTTQCKAISYTMSCFARPNHISCQACQAVPYHTR